MAVQAGDIGFAHNRGMMGRLIRLGETVRFKKWSTWNHQFVVSQVLEDGTALIIQATLRGVIESPLATVAPGGRYVTVAPPDAVDRHEFLVFCRSQLGTCYGVGTILAIAVDIVTWNWFPSFRGARKQSWICSALVNEGLRYGGWLHEWVDIYDMTPAQSYSVLVR